MADLTDYSNGEVLTEDALGEKFNGQSWSTGVIPGELYGHDDRELWGRMRQRVLLGLPPANPVEALLRSVLDALMAVPGGRDIKRGVVITGIRLAVGQTHGVRVQTHPRDIARHLGVKYQTLLKVRTLARKQITTQGIRMDLPEWLGWDWS